MIRLTAALLLLAGASAVAATACLNPTGIDDGTPGAYDSAAINLPPDNADPANSIFFTALGYDVDSAAHEASLLRASGRRRMRPVD